MAHPYRDEDEWEDVASYHADQLASHAGSRLGSKTTLEQGFTANWDPSTGYIDTTANQNSLASQQAGDYIYYHDQYGGHSGGGGNAEPHQHLSEHSVYSDFNSTASVDPVTVQTATKGTFTWCDNSNSNGASTADSAYWSMPYSSIHQAADPSLAQTVSSLPYAAIETSPENYSEDLHIARAFQDSTPWHPGAREQQQQQQEQLDQEDSFHFQPANYWLDPTHYNHDDTADYPPHPHVVDEETPSVAESQPSADASSQPKRSVRSRSKYAGLPPYKGVTTCEHCGAHFTGRYRRGNWARHVRQQHARKSAQQASDCVCRVCKKPFARQDARRKHEWRKHGLQDTRPCPRRQEEMHEDTTSHTGTYKTGLESDQGTLTHIEDTPQEPAISMPYRVPARPQHVHEHFAAVKAEFGDVCYDDYCDAFLEENNTLVHDLHDKQSAIYHIFHRALRNLSKQLVPDQPKYEASPSVSQGHLVDGDNHTRGKQPAHHGNQGKAPASRRTSNASARPSPYGRPPKKTNGDRLIALLALFKPLQGCSDLDCPVNKWYSVNANPGSSPCNGCTKEHMNGVRQHLGPDYSQQHINHVSFIKRCGRCKEDIISAVTWQTGGHNDKTCPSVTQPRDIEVLVWARLYLKIFPHEWRIPSPYVNDTRFLPDALVVQIRQGLQSTAPMSLNTPRTPDIPQQDLPNHVGSMRGGEDQGHAATPAVPDFWTDMADVTDEDIALDMMIARGEQFVESLKAEKRIRSDRRRLPVDGVEAEFHARRQTQQQQTWQMAPEYSNGQMPTPATRIPGQSSAIGSADFQLPKEQSNVMVGAVQMPGSYTGTQPSTHSYFEDTSYRHPSMLNSSWTDYDSGQPSSYVDQSPSGGMQLYTQMDFSNAISDDPRLDVPGSSSLPQAIAEEIYDSRYLVAEIDRTHRMKTSPSQSPYDQAMSNSHTPHEYDEQDFEPAPFWYDQ